MWLNQMDNEGRAVQMLLGALNERDMPTTTEGLGSWKQLYCEGILNEFQS